MITLHPFPELKRRTLPNAPRAGNAKATAEDRRPGPNAPNRDECRACARRSNAESC